MGGSKSKPATQAPSTVWNPQTPYLQDLYSQAQNTYNANQGNTQAQGYLDQFGQQLGMAGNQFGMANQGLQGGYGALGDARQGFNSFMNPGANPASDMYARMAGQQFNEQIMPGLQGDAMVAGGLGNSRAGIAQGLAGARMGQQLQDWNAQLYGEDMNRKLQASQGLAGLGGQYGDLAGMQGQLGQQYGLLGGQYGQLANAQQSLPWMALNQYRGLLGNPTVLGGGGTGATQASSGWGGTVASLAGLALAPATGGASLLAAGAVNQGLNSYYK